MDSDNNGAVIYSRETAEEFARQIEDFRQQISTYQQQCGVYYAQHPDEYTPEVQESLQAQYEDYDRQLTVYQQQYVNYCAALAVQEGPDDGGQQNFVPQSFPEIMPSEYIQEAIGELDPECMLHVLPQPPAMHDVTGILLDDVPYDDSNRKRASLDDVPDTKLEKNRRYDDSNRKRASLVDIPVPVIQAVTYVDSGERLSAQLEQIEAPQLEEDGYTPPIIHDPKKNIDDVAFPVLSDMNEEIKPVYVRKETEDERRAKEESKKATTRARTAMEAAPEINKEESLRMYRELRAEQNAEIASKGFKLIFIVAGLGIALGVCIYLFFAKIELSAPNSLLDKVKEFSPYFAGAVGLFSVLTILRLGFAKTLASLSYIANIILMLISITLLMNCTNPALTVPFYAASVILSGFLVFFLNTNEPIEKFFKRKDTDKTY